MEPWIFELATKIVSLSGHSKWEKTRDEIAEAIEEEVYKRFGRAVAEGTSEYVLPLLKIGDI